MLFRLYIIVQWKKRDNVKNVRIEKKASLFQEWFLNLNSRLSVEAIRVLYKLITVHMTSVFGDDNFFNGNKTYFFNLIFDRIEMDRQLTCSNVVEHGHGWFTDRSYMLVPQFPCFFFFLFEFISIYRVVYYSSTDTRAYAHTQHISLKITAWG